MGLPNRMLHCRAMEELTETERRILIDAIASREAPAKELAHKYGYSVADLRAFTEANLEAIQLERTALDQQEAEAAATLTPKQLDDLWITNKFERLKRYQAVCDKLYRDAMNRGLAGTEFATALRELRSYMLAVGNELGQLLHRGAGDAGTGDVASYDIQGVDLENLR